MLKINRPFVSCRAKSGQPLSNFVSWRCKSAAKSSSESSNVDLANELVRLMILQRSYSANSQSLKAVDQTLRDTIQMVG